MGIQFFESFLENCSDNTSSMSKLTIPKVTIIKTTHKK
jgi:hypothetical protein